MGKEERVTIDDLRRQMVQNVYQTQAQQAEQKAEQTFKQNLTSGKLDKAITGSLEVILESKIRQENMLSDMQAEIVKQVAEVREMARKRGIKHGSKKPVPLDIQMKLNTIKRNEATCKHVFRCINMLAAQESALQQKSATVETMRGLDSCANDESRATMTLLLDKLGEQKEQIGEMEADIDMANRDIKEMTMLNTMDSDKLMKELDDILEIHPEPEPELEPEPVARPVPSIKSSIAKQQPATTQSTVAKLQALPSVEDTPLFPLIPSEEFTVSQQNGREEKLAEEEMF